jgi:hypothetical protein
VTTFDDVDTVDLNIEIEDNGVVYTFPMRLLSHAEYIKIGYEIPQTVPPIMGADKQGRPVYDRNNPDYQAQIDWAERQRNYRRLAASLKIDIPGDTLAEKADMIQSRWNFNVCNQLLGAMMNKAVEGQWRVQQRAETFHRNGTGDAAHSGAVGTGDPGSMDPTLGR